MFRGSLLQELEYQSRAADEAPTQLLLCTRCPLDSTQSREALDSAVHARETRAPLRSLCNLVGNVPPVYPRAKPARMESKGTGHMQADFNPIEHGVHEYEIRFPSSVAQHLARALQDKHQGRPVLMCETRCAAVIRWGVSPCDNAVATFRDRGRWEGKVQMGMCELCR